MDGALIFPIVFKTKNEEPYEASLGLLHFNELLFKTMKKEASRLHLKETMVEARQKEILGSFHLMKSMIEKSRGVKLSDEALATEESPWGFKEIFVLGSDNDFSFSFSHKEDLVVAVSSRRVFPVGIDLEKIDEAKIRAFKRYVNDEEIALIQGLSEIERCTLLFSAKEAVSKVIRLGFSVSKTIYDIQSVKKLERVYEIHFKYLNSLKVEAALQRPFAFSLAFMKESSLESSANGFSSFLENIVP